MSGGPGRLCCLWTTATDCGCGQGDVGNLAQATSSPLTTRLAAQVKSLQQQYQAEHAVRPDHDNGAASRLR